MAKLSLLWAALISAFSRRYRATNYLSAQKVYRTNLPQSFTVNYHHKQSIQILPCPAVCLIARLFFIIRWR